LFDQELLQIDKDCLYEITIIKKCFFNMNPTILSTYNIIKIFLLNFSVKVHLEISMRFIHRNEGSKS
jgi:hypothetical protein